MSPAATKRPGFPRGPGPDLRRYGVWTAGVGFQLGCERFGALAIPAGPGNIDLQLQFIVDFKTTVLCCTASMALLLPGDPQARPREKIHVKR